MCETLVIVWLTTEAFYTLCSSSLPISVCHVADDASLSVSVIFVMVLNILYSLHRVACVISSSVFTDQIVILLNTLDLLLL